MEINRMIDHTLLKPNATRAQIEKLCDEALEYHFASVCVNTCWVPLCAEKLAGSDVNTCCVVGFPLGAMLPAAIAEETRMAVEAGADEVDMVINVGWLKDGDYDAVRNQIAGVVKAANGKCVKVIIEASNNVLTGALRQLFAVSESYPELKANANFQQLQNQLEETENKIVYARQSFNDCVLMFNNAIQTFPGSLFAGGRAPKKGVEISDADAQAPQVKF